MILPGRAWIQVESKHFSCPTDAQAAECRWRNLTVIQSGAAINSWLAASTGNISTPLILAYVLRNFSPPFLASLPNLTAFFTLVSSFSPHCLLQEITSSQGNGSSQRAVLTSSPANLLLSVLWPCLHLQPFVFLFLLLVEEVLLLLWEESFSSSAADPMLSCLLRVLVDYFCLLYLYPLFLWTLFSFCIYILLYLTDIKLQWPSLPFSFLHNPHIFIKSSLLVLYVFFILLTLSISFYFLPQYSTENC